MNFQKLSLSALVIAGLVAGGTPATLKAQVTPGRKTFIGLLGLTLITWRLEAKKSVEKPEDHYTWSDIPANVMKGDVSEAWNAFDERFIGQKAKGTAVKLVPGDEKVKDTSATPATGVCGNAQVLLTQFSKAALETGKLLVAPGIFMAFWAKALEFKTKDGSFTFDFDVKKLCRYYGFGYVETVEKEKEEPAGKKKKDKLVDLETE